jgi:hypothetical protein
MRNSTLPQQLKLGQHLTQAGIGINAALDGAAGVVAGLEPTFRLAAEHRIGRVSQHFMPGVSLQQLQPVGIGIDQRAIAPKLTARAARCRLRRVQLHGQRQQQVAGVGMRAAQQMAGPVLRRGVELRARLVNVGIGRHGSERIAAPSQEVRHA